MNYDFREDGSCLLLFDQGKKKRKQGILKCLEVEASSISKVLVNFLTFRRCSARSAITRHFFMHFFGAVMPNPSLSLSKGTRPCCLKTKGT